VLFRSGNAVSGTNYTPLYGGASGTATIPSGQNHVDIPISTISVAGTQGNLTAILTIASNTTYRIGTPASATLTITDAAAAATATPATIEMKP